MFTRHARSIHVRRALSSALTGAALGSALGALAAVGLWALRLGAFVPWSLALAALGAGAGAVHGFLRRWSDTDLALYCDARLDSSERVTTAVACSSRTAEGDAAFAHVLESATRVLTEAEPRRLRPALFSRLHALLPIAVVAILALYARPRAPAPKGEAAAPGTSIIQRAQVPGLERIEALAELKSRTPEQEARLKGLAEQAHKLREALKLGLERREALSQIGRLRDGISAERLRFGDQKNRAGLDAALGALGESPKLGAAKRALEDGDLTAFDAEMQKLANRAERSDRDVAKQVLEDAAKAARQKGAKELADALDSERRLFERREARAEALRELAQSLKGKLPPSALDDLKEFGTSGNPDAERRLAEALNQALEGLTPEERKRLSEQLAKRLESAAQGAAPMTKKELEELARRLSDKDNVDRLREELRELANQDPSDDARRERGLGDAERGAQEAERGLGGLPIPMDSGSGSGKPSDGPGKPGSNNGSGGPGSKHDEGTGNHAGSTPEVAGNELRAKAHARIEPGLSMRGAALGRAPARAGETANQLGTGSLGSVGHTEVGAVDHSDIPEEYRQQIGRYFEP